MFKIIVSHCSFHVPHCLHLSLHKAKEDHQNAHLQSHTYSRTKRSLLMSSIYAYGELKTKGKTKGKKEMKPLKTAPYLSILLMVITIRDTLQFVAG